MRLEETNLKGLYTVIPEILEDHRGYFTEFFRSDYFKTKGVDATFIQQNISVSKKGVIRGLHFQWEPPLGKLIRVTNGCIFAVAVDIRKQSPTLGKWFSLELSQENKKGLYVPPGFAYGFCAQDDLSEVQYLYTAHYNSKGESSILWNDPALGIIWPIQNPILSERDASAKTLGEWLSLPESDCF